jgi:hypothetical protein
MGGDWAKELQLAIVVIVHRSGPSFSGLEAAGRRGLFASRLSMCLSFQNENSAKDWYLIAAQEGTLQRPLCTRGR